MKLIGPKTVGMRLPVQGGVVLLDQGKAWFAPNDGEVTDEVPDGVVPDAVFAHGFHVAFPLPPAEPLAVTAPEES